jgi:hypothetical protein
MILGNELSMKIRILLLLAISHFIFFYTGSLQLLVTINLKCI